METKGKKALVVIDVQNDFCRGGALEVPGGDLVVPVLNEYIGLFTRAGLPIYLTRDWHPKKSVHFKEYGGLWPAHCVQGTGGARFYPGLTIPPGALVITKGDDPDRDTYSDFEGHDDRGRGFAGILREDGVGHLYVGGLATDYCVKATTLDALKEGLRVTVLTDAIRGVEVSPGDSQRAMDEMLGRGATTATLPDMDISRR